MGLVLCGTMRRFPWGCWAALLIPAIQAALASAQGAEGGGGPREEYVTNPAPPLVYFGALITIAAVVAIYTMFGNRQSYENNSSKTHNYTYGKPETKPNPPESTSSSGNSEVRNRKMNSQAKKDLEKKTTEQEPEHKSSLLGPCQNCSNGASHFLKPALAERSAEGSDRMAGESFLQDFYTHRVFVQGYEEDFRAWRDNIVVKDTVKKLDEWLYQSNRRLFPNRAKLMGSQRQELHIQNDTSGSDFDFLIPLRFNPTLELMGRLNVRDLSTLETRLPNSGDPSEKLLVFSWGSKLVLDPHKLRATKLYPPTGNSSAGQTDQFGESIKNRYLDPVCILQVLHSYVENALTADENSHPRDNDPMWQAQLQKPRVPQIHKSVKESSTLKSKCPAVQLIFRRGKDEKVSVDLVPALQDKVVLSEEWLRDDLARLSDWWDKLPDNSQERFLQKRRTVRRVGADVVAKDRFWRFSPRRWS